MDDNQDQPESHKIYPGPSTSVTQDDDMQASNETMQHSFHRMSSQRRRKLWTLAARSGAKNNPNSGSSDHENEFKTPQDEESMWTHTIPESTAFQQRYYIPVTNPGASRPYTSIVVCADLYDPDHVAGLSPHTIVMKEMLDIEGVKSPLSVYPEGATLSVSRLDQRYRKRPNEPVDSSGVRKVVKHQKSSTETSGLGSSVDWASTETLNQARYGRHPQKNITRGQITSSCSPILVDTVPNYENVSNQSLQEPATVTNAPTSVEPLKMCQYRMPSNSTNPTFCQVPSTSQTPRPQPILYRSSSITRPLILDETMQRQATLVHHNSVDGMRSVKMPQYSPRGQNPYRIVSRHNKLSLPCSLSMYDHTLYPDQSANTNIGMHLNSQGVINRCCRIYSPFSYNSPIAYKGSSLETSFETNQELPEKSGDYNWNSCNQMTPKTLKIDPMNQKDRIRRHSQLESAVTSTRIGYSNPASYSLFSPVNRDGQFSAPARMNYKLPKAQCYELEQPIMTRNVNQPIRIARRHFRQNNYSLSHLEANIISPQRPFKVYYSQEDDTMHSFDSDTLPNESQTVIRSGPASIPGWQIKSLSTEDSPNLNSSFEIAPRRSEMREIHRKLSSSHGILGSSEDRPREVRNSVSFVKESDIKKVSDKRPKRKKTVSIGNSPLFLKAGRDEIEIVMEEDALITPINVPKVAKSNREVNDVLEEEEDDEERVPTPLGRPNPISNESKYSTKLNSMDLNRLAEYWDHAVFTRSRMWAGLLTSISIIMIIYAMAATSWGHSTAAEVNGSTVLKKYFVGLWQECVSEPNCVYSTNQTLSKVSRKTPTLCFLFLGLMFGLMGLGLNFIGHLVSSLSKQLYYFHSGGEILFIASFCIFLGIMVFLLNCPDVDESGVSQKLEMGSGFRVATLSVAFYLASAILLILDHLVQSLTKLAQRYPKLKPVITCLFICFSNIHKSRKLLAQTLVEHYKRKMERKPPANS